MTEVRRLNPDADEALIREAVGWLAQYPRWCRDADAAWGVEGADAYLAQMRDERQADFGVFDEGELLAVITLTLEGKGAYNSHLMVRPGASPEPIAAAASGLIKSLKEAGMREGWAWLAAKNRGVRRIVEAVGMRLDGVTQFKGQSHGQPIEWVRYSVGA